MSKNDVHIVRDKSGPGWDVKQGGEVQSSHRTQQAAVGALELPKATKSTS